MKVLIVEDVTLVAKRIATLCMRFIPCEPCDIAFDLTTAKAQCLKHHYDLIFLDLNINGANGFDLLALDDIDPQKVIVITAYQERAALAYEHTIFDFITKPIIEKRFSTVANRFLQNHPHLQQHLVINKSKLQLKVPLKHINFLKAAGNYTEVFTLDGQSHLIDIGINHIEKQFSCFVRCHRSYLTRLENVHSISKLGAGQYRLNLINETTIPLSRSYYLNSFKASMK